MSELPDIQTSAEIRLGQDPILDAWVLHFMAENNLDYLLNPLHNASPEQLRFMVALDEDQVYVPSADSYFLMLLQPTAPPELLQAYTARWRNFSRLVVDNTSPGQVRSRMVQFARHRFRIALASHIMIPSRMSKRLYSIFLTQSGIEDPAREIKKLSNRRAADLLGGKSLQRLLYACPEGMGACGVISEMRKLLDRLELRRLLCLSAWAELWTRGQAGPGVAGLEKEMHKPCPDFAHIDAALDSVTDHGREHKNILYLPNESGGVIVDLLIARSLIRQGHNVVMALKDGFSGLRPTIWDLDCDPVLATAIGDGHVLTERKVSKNQLLQAMRANQLLIISDGCKERFNPYKTSVTFARAWKECDLVIAKGRPHARRLIENSHQFTTDILCFYRDPGGSFRAHFKPKAPGVQVFTEADLRAKADDIIHAMREAKQAGKKVMFYSAIVGSIPGQTRTAIRVLQTFVDYLRSRHDSIFIINPAEHFEEGLDGDDLMYMWERVQRSGLLDIWRFQTVADVERSFELMDEPVPPAWIGKDATYSTGCTKEMSIALEVQARRPEMQIIGPSPEKFFRRREYGVGKYYDAGIEVM